VLEILDAGSCALVGMECLTNTALGAVMVVYEFTKDAGRELKC
jgi:hypothetical protein